MARGHGGQDGAAGFAALAALGRIGPSDQAIRTVLDRLRADPRAGAANRLFSGLCQSKVSRLALAALDASEPGNTPGPVADLRTLLASEVAADDAWQQQAVPRMREAVRDGAARGARVIKGLAVQAEYPDPGLRHLGDVDMHFPDWASGMPTVWLLRGQGWVHDTAEYPWLKWHDTGLIYGQLSLVFPTAEAPYARVDLHIGPFSVGHAGAAPLLGWQAGRALDVPVTVPAVETSILIVAAHAMGDQLLSVKDINDLHVLITRQVPDWLSLAESCRAVQALPVLAQLLEATRAAYPEDSGKIPQLRLEPASLTPVPASQAQRARTVARYTYRDEKSRGAGPLAAALQARSARKYFTADLSPRENAGTQAAAIGAHRRDLCWRLIPRQVWGRMTAGSLTGTDQASQLDTGLLLVRNGEGAVVVCGADVFVPTVWGNISPESVALAQRVCGSRGELADSGPADHFQ